MRIVLMMTMIMITMTIMIMPTMIMIIIMTIVYHSLFEVRDHYCMECNNARGKLDAWQFARTMPPRVVAPSRARARVMCLEMLRIFLMLITLGIYDSIACII